VIKKATGDSSVIASYLHEKLGDEVKLS